MSDLRPGLNPQRLVGLMREAVARCRLNLSGCVVLTEAATGAYVVTPLLAALAGAEKVYGVTRDTPYGSAREVAAQTEQLARLTGFNGRIKVITDKSPGVVARADVVTNSGHVRPIDRGMIERMKRTAVIPLMYESWEFRQEDVDLSACRCRGVQVAGTNERHPNVNVFSDLPGMAIKLLLDAGIGPHGSNILIVCDNPFAPFLRDGLVRSGACVKVTPNLREAAWHDRLDAIMVATTPAESPGIGAAECELIVRRWPGAVVIQYWGEVDRAALDNRGIAYWPVKAPPRGHMGVLPSAVGPAPVVRLQTGGLKVAEILLRCGASKTGPEWEYVDVL